MNLRVRFSMLLATALATPAAAVALQPAAAPVPAPVTQVVPPAPHAAPPDPHILIPPPPPVELPPPYWDPRDAQELLTYIQNVGREGLDPADYDPQGLAAALRTGAPAVIARAAT